MLLDYVQQAWKMLRLIKSLCERLEDWYLTKTTGHDKLTRERMAWVSKHINYRADRVKNYFDYFKFVFIVDWSKVSTGTEHDPFTWRFKEDFKSYMWPNKPLGEQAEWALLQVIKGWDEEYHINGIGGNTYMFVATNNEHHAMMLMLKYG